MKNIAIKISAWANTFLFLSLAFCSYNTQAQTSSYQSIFGKENTRWNCLAEWDFQGLAGPGSVMLNSSVDTLLGNLWYKKIEITFSGRLLGLKPNAFLLREDTLQGKIWYREIQQNTCGLLDTTDQLIVDLNLNVGDSFDITGYSHYFFNDPHGIVDSIYFDASYRKHIRFKQIILPPYLQAPLYAVEFIEGVGPKITLLYRNTCNYAQKFVLVCAYKDNQQIFYDNRYSSCDPLKELAVKSSFIQNNIKIFPNPASNTISIVTMNDLEIKTLIITDVTGRIIYSTESQTLYSNLPFVVKVNTFALGVYLVSIKDNKGVNTTTKFVKF